MAKQKKAIGVPKEEDKNKPAVPHNAQGQEKEIQDFIDKRVDVLKRSRKNVLNKINFDKLMEDADREYEPYYLSTEKEEGPGGGVYLEKTETAGVRGAKVVKTGESASDEDWMSNLSEPTLFVKIQTALSVILQQNPEATFKATIPKYKKTTNLAKGIWKRSWEVAKSKEQTRAFVFNLAKYGWAPMKTYPRIEKRDKEVLVELDLENPDNNKYKTKTIIDFNDVYRQALDPRRTWIDDMANMVDQWSLNDWYYEEDFSADKFEQLFGNYTNYKKVVPGNPVREGESVGDSTDNLNGETQSRDDIITLGFYENRLRDLYAIRDLRSKILLYYGPLPNDDGKLTISDGVWNMRDPNTRYGIGLYEILKNDKVMYDRWDNMTTDQLVMAVYKMLFYSGPQSHGDNTIRVTPGIAKQKSPGTTVESVDVKFEARAFEWLDRRRQIMDNNTGITPTLQGEVQGKTLGEILHAKDSALKRLNIPIANICSVLENDAELTLSWANQMYSLPEIMEFESIEDLQEFMDENDSKPDQTEVDEKTGKITADFPRRLEMHLDEDREGNLIESPESRIFTVGQEVEKKSIKWKGKVIISAKSIFASSPELDRQRKLELFNIVTPVVQMMAGALAQGQFSVALAMAKPVTQILEVQDEDPKQWLPDEVNQMIENPALAKEAENAMKMKAMQDSMGGPLFVSPEEAKAGSKPARGGAPTSPAPGMPTAPAELSPKAEKVAPMPQSAVSRSMNSTLAGETRMTQ